MSSQVQAAALDGYANLPGHAIPMERNSSKQTVAATTPICAVLRACCQTQIGPAIVQPVAVCMVDMHIGRRLKNEAMEVDLVAPVAGAVLSVEPAATIRTGVPGLLRDALIILVIDESDLTASERNLTHAANQNSNRQPTPQLPTAAGATGKTDGKHGDGPVLPRRLLSPRWG